MVDSLASGVPLAAEHAQVLDRLRQLTVWQQAQQERLRAHQQQQIAILRGEHASTSPLVPSVTQLEPVGSPNPHSQCQGPPSPSSPPSQRPGNQTCADSTAVVNSEWTGLQQVQQYGELEQPVVTGGRGNEGSGGERGGGEGSGCVSDSGLETGGQGSEEETELTRGGEEATGGGEDRPIQSGVGMSWIAQWVGYYLLYVYVGESGTFEELVERQMRLHCGDEVWSPADTHTYPHSLTAGGDLFSEDIQQATPISETRGRTGKVQLAPQKFTITQQTGEDIHEATNTATIPGSDTTNPGYGASNTG